MNQKEIILLIQSYAATGDLDDGLLPYFDQHGKWQGGVIKWNKPFPKDLKELMAATTLPESRRESSTKSGMTLHTSYIWRSAKPLKINYSKIEGSLNVHRSVAIHAANLRQIGGHLISPTNNKIYLPRLRSVGGQVDLIHGFLLNAPRLREVGRDLVISGHLPPKLEAVGGRLSVFGDSTLDAPLLRHIGGAFLPNRSREILVPSLESIGGGFHAFDCDRSIHAPRLELIGADFLAPNVRRIRMPRLCSVGGDMATSSAHGFYHPRIKVAGTWTTAVGAVENWHKREMVLQVLRGPHDTLYL